MITCARFDDLLLSSIEGALSPDEHADFHGHLGECSHCVADLETYVSTVVVLQGLPPHEAADPTPPLREGLVQRILTARRGEGFRQVHSA
jgi:hypothetical protein